MITEVKKLGHLNTVQIMYFYVRNNERRTVNTVSGSSPGAPKSQRRSSTKQQNAELPNDVLERDSNVSWRRRLLKKVPHRNVLLLKPFLKNRNPFPKNWTFHRRSDIRREPINMCWWNLNPVARQAAPHILIARCRVLPFRLLYMRNRPS